MSITSFSECNESSNNFVQLNFNDASKRLDITIDNKYFTSYLFQDSILRKPVLYPIYTSNEIRVTRGFPFSSNPGERIDHPHHYGIWFNHGIVNEVDYWNSSVDPVKPHLRYGRIEHKAFLKIESGKVGKLQVEKEWFNDEGKLVLNEVTTYTFSGDKNTRTITHETTLMAPNEDVFFKDSKEGMFGIRVRRELEVPSDEPAVFLDENLEPFSKKIINQEHVTGHYRNSENIEGYPDVWGKRAKWVQLSGQVDKENIAITIFDHPSNINHPPHWHARDYGLFSVNSLGSSAYTKGKEEMNFTLKKGASISFKHQVIIANSTEQSLNEIEDIYKKAFHANQ